MKYLNTILELYLSGKPIYARVLRILNILFSVSITSFLFEKIYFKYTWIDITDYKAIVDFFVRGHFIIPSIMFFIVDNTIYILSWWLFATTGRKYRKIIKDVAGYNLGKLRSVEINMQAPDDPALAPTLSSLFAISYTDVKSSMDINGWMDFEKRVRRLRPLLRNSFMVAVKVLVALPIYFYTVRYFGTALFVFTLIFTLIMLRITWWLYVTVHIGPTFVKKG